VYIQFTIKTEKRAFIHQRCRSIYIRLTHLVGEFTASRCGTKPQTLLNEGASHKIECMCIAQSKERGYIRHTYLVKGKTLCIQFVYILREGVFLCIRFVQPMGIFKTSCSWYTTCNFNHNHGINMQ